MKIHTLLASIALAGVKVHAETGMHACQAEPAAQSVYNQHRNSPDRVKALREALAANPDDLFLNRWLLLSPGIRAGSLSAEYRAKLDAHPAAPLFLYLYGHSWIGKDTPQAAEVIERTLTNDPELVYGYQTLLEIYASPNFRDRAKVARNLRAYTARCLRM
jgi:predicted Zn-dependent protease